MVILKMTFTKFLIIYAVYDVYLSQRQEWLECSAASRHRHLTSRIAPSPSDAINQTYTRINFSIWIEWSIIIAWDLKVSRTHSVEQKIFLMGVFNQIEAVFFETITDHKADIVTIDNRVAFCVVVSCDPCCGLFGHDTEHETRGEYLCYLGFHLVPHHTHAARRALQTRHCRPCSIPSTFTTYHPSMIKFLLSMLNSELPKIILLLTLVLVSWKNDVNL